MNLGQQFNSLGNNNGQHGGGSPQSGTVGTPDAAQGGYMGKHRQPSEQWNPANGGDWSETQYQSHYGSSPTSPANPNAGDANIQPVQFTGGLGNVSRWD
jgi:hypothetical protein